MIGRGFNYFFGKNAHIENVCVIRGVQLGTKRNKYQTWEVQQVLEKEHASSEKMFKMV